MMDWRLFASTFALIFLAELGDKTQLAALAASAGARSPWSVFAGAASALVVATLIATRLGSALQRFLPQHYLRGGAAILFFLFGILLLLSAFRSREAFAAVPERSAKPGVVSSIVFNAARDFEKASLADYDILARAHASSEAGEMFLHLAAEERGHLDALTHLASAHGEAQWEQQAIEPPAAPGATAAMNEDVRAAAAAAMRHEQAATAFYRRLAETSAIPAVRSALSELARAENAHADHLRIFLGTGRFDEPSV